MSLYFKTDDGTYHELKEIIAFQESIVAKDDKLFGNSDADGDTVRHLATSGYFEAELSSVSNEAITKIFADIDALFTRHVELINLYWIAELCKRYIVEHSGCDGCVHKGAWENEVELGYSSPCTVCKRRASDWYEKGVSE